MGEPGLPQEFTDEAMAALPRDCPAPALRERVLCSLLREPGWYDRLDPGIIWPVKVLHAAGVDTSSSCQGGMGHPYPRPIIYLAGAGHAEGHRAFAALRFQLVPVWRVAQVRTAVHDDLGGAEWTVEFGEPFPELADAWPTVIWYQRRMNTMESAAAVAATERLVSADGERQRG